MNRVAERSDPERTTAAHPTAGTIAASRTARTSAAPRTVGTPPAAVSEAARLPARLPVRVPRPEDEAGVVELGPLAAGGLTAVRAEWGADGGAVTLTGAAPFAALTGHAGFRSDGSLDGIVRMRAAVRFLDLDLGEVAWTVHDWSPEVPLATPSVALRGDSLAVDLQQLPRDATWTAPEGIDAPRHGDQAVVQLPGDGAGPGVPLSPRLAEVYRGLGLDVSRLRVHADRPGAGAPAFVTDQELFFAPGIYGAESPEALRVLDSAVRAALAGLLDPVTGEPVQVVPPAPPEAEAPTVEVSVVPATVPEGPATVPEGPATAVTGSVEETAEKEPIPDAAPVTSDIPAEGAPGASAAEEAPAPLTVQLLMPEPPTVPTPATVARGAAFADSAGRATRAARDLPTADVDVADAQAAVTEPAAETAARARLALAAELGQRPAPSPEIVELCARIRTAIRANRPEDEKELLKTDRTKEAQQAGATLTRSVEGQAEQIGSSYDALAAPPAGTPALTPEPIAAPSPASPGLGVDAASAAPDPIPPENTTLDADVAATDQRIADSGIDTRVTREIPDGPFAAARDARAGLGEVAQRTPQQIQAEQQQAIESAQADMAQLQQHAVAALRGARSGTVTAVGGGQSAAVATQERTRESASLRARNIYDEARKHVDALLRPLSGTAIARWDAGLTRLSQEFHDTLDPVQRWVDERHSGVGGAIIAVADYLTGLPDWVTQEYDRAEEAFGDGVCSLLLGISTDVNGVVAAAQAVVEHARSDIDAVFREMEAEFPEWAAQERARFAGLLDGLSRQVTEARTGFVRDVSERAVAAVNQVHAQVQALREEAGGLIGRVATAIGEFADDPARAIINGLLRLVGIPPAEFWALVAKIEQVLSDMAADPETFVNNLVAGVRQGFERFFGNFGRHVLHGFWQWLFSSLKTPIPMPRDLSPKSLFSFALQLMGVTWPRVREILVRHVGARAVEVVEAAWQFVSVLIERGPEGLVDLLKEQLDPENLVGMILDAAVGFLTETLIQQVVVRVVGLLNPVGAVAQAIDLIYRVCSWIFRNAARIFRFVEAVVNGMADVVAGNIAGLAGAVEKSLTVLIPPVIDFLAGLLHLDGLPGEVAKVIARLQAVVYAAMDRVIGFLAAQARALLARMGLGGENRPKDGDDELGATVRFSAAHEHHRLFFRTAGDDAALMVASAPQPIQDKIADWRGRLGQLPKDQQAPTATKLDALAAAADAANKEGAALAGQFLKANHDPKDAEKPPNDDSVEARERAVAGMLGELFKIFGESGSETAYRADIAVNLPVHGRATSREVVASWADRYARRPLYVREHDSKTSPVWNPDPFAEPTIKAGQAYLGQEDVQSELLPYFAKKGKQAKAGLRADTVAFRDYALGADGHGQVGGGFLTALGNAYEQQLTSCFPKDIDPVDSEWLDGAQVRYKSGPPSFGGFTPPLWQGERADPPLKERTRNMEDFLIGIARTGSFDKYTEVRLQWAWTHEQSKDFLERRFRGKHKHEWIPTNLVPELLREALNARKGNAGLELAVKWLKFQFALRSQTNHVMWHFTPEPAGHVGAFSTDKQGRRSAGTSKSGPFHDWLRGLYRKHKYHGPRKFALHLRADIKEWVWNGETSGIIANHLDDRISVWYRHDDGKRETGLTIRELAERQRRNYDRIMEDFDKALTELDKED